MGAHINNIISPYLCGFRKGYSAQHALLRLFSNLNKYLDSKKKVGIFMMDLSKAFDCIPHDLLVAKFHSYGFSKQSLQLLYSFLKSRNQRVKINSNYSSWKEMISGVPQGSILGPLLFNIFINDLFFFVNESDVCNYADDNTLSYADYELEKIVEKLENDISNLEEWFKHNGLTLNEKKCQFMIIEPSWITRNEITEITINNKVIQESSKAKLLGLNLCNDLSMDEHVKSISKKASKKLQALARIAPFLDEQKRKLLMNSFITSQFNYCPIIWMFCQRRSNNIINKIHERALRIAYRDYTSDFESLLIKDDSITIHQRNVQCLVIEIHKTINNLNPIFMKNIFSLKKQSYHSRFHHLDVTKPRTMRYGFETFGYKAAHIWSQIPKNI